MLDWVNSIDIPSCLLVSDLEDLRTGEAFCDLISAIKGERATPALKRHIRPEQRSDCLNNLAIVLGELGDLMPLPMRKLTANSLYTSEVCLVDTLRLLIELIDPDFSKVMNSSFNKESILRSHSNRYEDESPNPLEIPKATISQAKLLKPTSTSPLSLAVSNENPLDSPEYQEIAIKTSFDDKSQLSFTPSKKAETGQQNNSYNKLQDQTQQKAFDFTPGKPPPRSASAMQAITKVTPNHAHSSPPTPKRRFPQARNLSITKLKEVSFEDKPLNPPHKLQSEAAPVSEAVQESIYLWVLNNKVIERKASLVELPQLFKSGVRFCDLINRLEGRTQPIKGVHRSPKNRSAVQANVNKLLTYLRGIPKVNARYLWSGVKIMEGNDDVIWGLLYDMYNYYHNKPKIDKPMTSFKQEATFSDTPKKPLGINSHQRNNSFNDKSMRLLDQNATISPKAGPFTVQKNNEPILEESPQEDNQDMSKLKGTILEWLGLMGLEKFVSEDDPDVRHNPLKNGVLICEIVMLLEQKKIFGVHRNPISLHGVKENFERALIVLKESKVQMPVNLVNSPDRFLKEPDFVWFFMKALMETYPYIPKELLTNPSTELPYTQLEIEKLDFSLSHWLFSLGVLNRFACPITIADMLEDIKTGVLLCDLVSKILGKNIPGVTRNPKTPQACKSNIIRALDLLRKNNRMSQKFLWKDEDILKGEYYTILGLLEDLHRFSDGLLRRKRGPEYHKDGPYLGKKAPFSRDHGLFRFPTERDERFVANTSVLSNSKFISPRSFISHSFVDAYDSASKFNQKQG